MSNFANSYPDYEFVQQLVAQIPWGHNVRILDKIKEPIDRVKLRLIDQDEKLFLNRYEE